MSGYDRVKRTRYKQMGYEGKPCPVAKEDYTPEGLELTQAWAEGVWKRQDEQMSRQRVADPK